MRKIRRCSLTLSAVAVLKFAFLVPSIVAQEVPANVVLQITDARNTMEVWVRKIKRGKAPSSAEYQEAQTRYELAKAKYDSWVSAVQAAILSDKVKKLEKDKDYKQAVTNAKSAGQDF